MRVGISTACLYPMEIERSIHFLLEQGFRDFEFFMNTESEISRGFVRMLKGMLEGAGARVKSLHPFTSISEGLMLFSDYPRRFQDGLDFYRRYFEAGAELRAEILVLHGAKTLFPVETGRYCERYAALNEAAKEYNMVVAQENVNGYKSADPQFLQEMRECLGDSVSFVLDIKQAVRAGFTPYEVANAMGNRVVHVHANDHEPGKDCLLPGQGRMDYAKLRRMLLKAGCKGDWIIEVYRKNFDKGEELWQAALYLEQALAV